MNWFLLQLCPKKPTFNAQVRVNQHPPDDAKVIDEEEEQRISISKSMIMEAVVVS